MTAPLSRVSANLLLMLVAVIWGSAFVAQSRGMAHVGPMTFTGVRFLIGALVVSPLMWLEWRRLGRLGQSLDKTDAFKIAGLGSLLLMGAAMQQIGIGGTSVTNAGFLTALYVPLVPVLSWLVLRQAPHWSVWPGAMACVVGAYLLSGAQSLSISQGMAGSSRPRCLGRFMCCWWGAWRTAWQHRFWWLAGSFWCVACWRWAGR